jgi:hypothetical protein
MALPQIDTGYKPEFALGALYQGQNAANANMSAEEELIKQFLANQREQQMQPLDVNIRQTESDRATVGRSPEMLDAYQRGYIGQNNSQDAAGKTAMALQPFVQAAQIAENKSKFNEQDLQNQIYQLDQQLGTEANPLNRMAMMKERERITRALKESPTFMGKRELRETGTDSNEYIAELNRLRDLEKARLAASAKGVNPPKTAEEALARQLTARYSAGEIDYATYMAELANIFNSKNAAKTQPGTTLDTQQLPPGTPLKEKPPQEKYTPGGVQQQSNKPTLEQAIAAELERRRNK